MSLGRYSIGVDIDQTGINAGTQQMITTLNNATAQMKNSMSQLALNLNATMSQITNSMLTGSQMATAGTTNSFQTMSNNIATSTKQATASVQQSAQQMSASLNGLQAPLNNVNLNGFTSSANNASGATGRLSTQMRTTAASTSFLSDKMRMLRQHLEWIATGAFLTALVGIPGMMIHAATETETLTQKIRQNLELGAQYHNNHEQLETDLGRLNDVAKTFAVGYGAKLGEVMDSMQILSRRFKDFESISYLTSAALTMNKLDFVDLRKASSDLEAVMLQFGLTAKGTQDFVNDFSVAVHVARINGTDLLDALQRSGSGFNQFKMGAREAIAAISALSTETARTGSTIGNTFKSITANFSMDKAVNALKAYDIQLYDTNENGMKVLRAGANVFQELQTLYARLDDEGKGKLSLAIAGGKFQVNAMSAFLADANKNFTTILNEMNDKSSNAMTKQLLQAGMDTFAVKMQQVRASIEVFAQTMGSKMLPSLKEFADRMTGSVIWIQQHNESVSEALGWVSKLALAYIGVKIATMAYGAASLLVTTWTGLQAIATAALTGSVGLATVGTWAHSAANVAATASTIITIAATQGLTAAFTALWAAMGPVGWVVLGITAVGTAIYLLYNNWKTSIEWMRTSWNSLVEYVAQKADSMSLVFVLIGGAATVLSTVFRAVVMYIKGAWNQLSSQFQTSYEVITTIIERLGVAFGGLSGSLGKALSNMGSQLGSFLYNLLPEWGKGVVDFFGDLGSKLNNITKSIGDTIRKNLSISNINGDGGVGSEAYGPQNKEKTPFELAQELAEDALAKTIAGNKIEGGGGKVEPDLANKLMGKNKQKKTPASETEYAIAKREYQAEIADEELTATQKIEIYKRMLDGKAIGEKELHDYAKGLGRLEVAEIKENRALKNAQLDLEIAEGKEKNESYYNKKIELLREEVENCKAGSVERVQAEIRVAEAKKELVKFQRDGESQRIAQEKQASLDLITVYDDQNKKLLSLYQLNQEQYTRTLLTAEDARYKIELGALEQKKKVYANDEKEAAKIQTEITKLTSSHARTRMGIEQELFKETQRYQLSALEGFRTGMTTALNGLLQWNMTFKKMVRELGKAIITNLGDVWIKDVVAQMSKGFAKMIGLTTAQKSKDVAAEEAKQSALTGVAAAGEATRLAATKVSITAAGAAGAAGATAMVGATTAAFTATLAMIEATAATIATILPEGPAIAAAIMAGVASSTAALTAAGTTATATISSLAVPSFEVGAWKLGQDQLAMVHEGETIIPKEPAQQFRDFVSNGDLASKFSGNHQESNKNEIHLHASAVDTRGLKPLVKAMGRDMVDSLSKQKRGFNVGKKRW